MCYQFWSSVKNVEKRVVTRGLESRFYDITASVNLLLVTWLFCTYCVKKIITCSAGNIIQKRKGFQILFLPPSNGIGGTWGGILTSFSCNSPHFPLFCPTSNTGRFGKIHWWIYGFHLLLKEENSGRFCQGRHEVNSALDCNWDKRRHPTWKIPKRGQNCQRQLTNIHKYKYA